MGDAWFGGFPLWNYAPNTKGVKLLQAYNEFYLESAFMDCYGLEVFDRNVDAVWHKNGDEIIILTKGTDNSLSNNIKVILDKSVIDYKTINEWTEIGDLNNVSIVETDQEIILQANLNGKNMGGAFISLL